MFPVNDEQGNQRPFRRRPIGTVLADVTPESVSICPDVAIPEGLNNDPNNSHLSAGFLKRRHFPSLVNSNQVITMISEPTKGPEEETKPSDSISDDDITAFQHMQALARYLDLKRNMVNEREDQVAKLQKEVEQLKEEKESLRKEQESKRREGVQRVQQELNSQLKKVTELEKDAARKDKEISGLQRNSDTISRLESELAEATRLNEAHRQRTETLYTRLARAKKEKKHAETERETAKNEAVTSEQAVERIRSDVLCWEEECLRLRNENRTLSHKHSEAMERITHLEIQATHDAKEREWAEEIQRLAAKRPRL